ncbi:MAG: hypothetical protein SVS85_02135 [Candidatus Nanohaloarchaea archaeon]|nr:hypothetical protein [Candidatus Nanohaloarchaea archaeon]
MDVNSPMEEKDLEVLGQYYASVKMKAWEEAYQTSQDFVAEFKKEFGVGRETGPAIALYDEMMEKGLEALGEDPDQDYDDRPTSVANAFVYLGNEEPDLPEFRDAVRSVLEKEKSWKHFAEDSVPA